MKSAEIERYVQLCKPFKRCTSRNLAAAKTVHHQREFFALLIFPNIVNPITIENNYRIMQSFFLHILYLQNVKAIVIFRYNSNRDLKKNFISDRIIGKFYR